MTRVSFTRAQLEGFRDATVPDLLPDDVTDLRLLLVGINPGLMTAATGTHFVGPGNRFYPALHLAGITSGLLRPRDGVYDRSELTRRGIGITNVVPRATARADELSRDEYRAGARRLATQVRSWQPRVVAIVGITAFRVAFRRPRAATGPQDDPSLLPPAATWVVPNPSGLNAHSTVESLARQYRAVAEAAGVPLDPPRW